MGAEDTTIIVRKGELPRLRAVKIERDLGSNARTVRFLLDFYQAQKANGFHEAQKADA